MIDKNGYEFEFAEKETGFVEEATAVFDNSAELLIIGFNPISIHALTRSATREGGKQCQKE